MVAMRPTFDDIRCQPGDPEEGHPDPREILFVVDPFQQNLQFVRIALNSALSEIKDPEQVLFNIIILSPSKLIQLFPKSTKARSQELEKAHTYIESPEFESAIRGGGSGISFTGAIKDLYHLDVASEEIPRVLFLVTHGQISRPTELLGFVDARSGEFSIFPLSIGNSGNFYVLHSLARLTSGFHEFALRPKKDGDFEKVVRSKAIRQMGRVLQPILEPVTVDWGSLRGPLLQTDLAPFWSGDLLFVYGLIPEIPEKITHVKIRAEIPVIPKNLEFPVILDPSVNCKVGHQKGVLHLQAVTDRLMQLSMDREAEGEVDALKAEAENIAIQFGISSSDTSFWAENESKSGYKVLLASSTDFGSQEEPDQDIEPRRKYSFDFLMRFKDQYTEAPQGFNPAFHGLVPKSNGESPQPVNRSTPKFQRPQRPNKLQITPQWETNNNELFREINSLLNKLTKDKFQQIQNKLIAKNTDIKSEEALRGIVDLVFEKAVSAPTYATIYSDLCTNLKNSYPKFNSQDNSGRVMDFRRILLNRCQKEFEEKRKEEPPPENLPEDEREEIIFKRRQRSQGNIKFVGELFKQNLLGPKIIHHVIVDLLKLDSDSELPDVSNLELGSKLIKTIGKTSVKQSLDYNLYFRKIETLSVDERLELRIRYLLEDLIELRKNNWVPRKGKGDTGPKTIKEVHEQAKQELEEKANAMARREKEQASRHSSSWSNSSGRQSGNNSGTSGRRSQTSTRTTSSSKTDPPPRSQSYVEKWITSPAKGRGRGTGSTGGIRNSQNNNRETGRDKDQGGRGQFKQPRGRGGGGVGTASVGVGGGGGGGGGGGARSGVCSAPISTQSTPTKRKSDGPGGASGSSFHLLIGEDEEDEEVQINNEPPSPSPSPKPQVAPPSKNQPSQQQQQQLTKTEVEKKVEQFLIEFQDSEESEVAYRCFLDVQGPFTPVETVNKALCLALDGNDRDRKIFLGLLRDFSSEWNVLTEEHFLEGYALVLSNINDYAIDIPHAYKYMANFILFATTNNLFPPSALENLMKPTVCSGDAAKIISELLLTLSLDQSLEAAKAYAANFDFKKFLKAEQQTKEGYSRYLQNNVSLIPILQ